MPTAGGSLLGAARPPRYRPGAGSRRRRAGSGQQKVLPLAAAFGGCGRDRSLAASRVRRPAAGLRGCAVCAAALVLALGAQVPVELLRDGLGDRSASVRRLAAIIMGNVGNAGSTAPLAAELARNPSAAVVEALASRPRCAGDARWSIHGLRGFDDLIAEDERPLAVGSDDDFRDNRKTAIDKNKFCAVALRIQTKACHVRPTQDYEDAVITVWNQQPIRVDSASFARSLACLQRPEGALAATLMGRNSVKRTRCLWAHSAVSQRNLRRSRPGPGAPPGPGRAAAPIVRGPPHAGAILE